MLQIIRGSFELSNIQMIVASTYVLKMLLHLGMDFALSSCVDRASRGGTANIRVVPHGV